MRQLIAVLIAVLLSACSYDPYHYYYSCTDEIGRYVDPIYIHNNVLKYGDYKFSLESESDVFLKFRLYYGRGPFLQIEKGTNRINYGTYTIRETFNCTLEKTLFKK